MSAFAAWLLSIGSLQLIGIAIAVKLLGSEKPNEPSTENCHED